MNETVRFAPRASLLTIWLTAVIVPVAVVMAIIFTANEESGAFGASIVVMGIILYLIAAVYLWLYYRSIGYELDEHYLLKRSGVLWKVRRSTPLDKITNLDVRQGPLERLLGMGQVWVFTPSTGQSMPEVKLLGLSRPHDTKEMIVERVERARALAAAKPEAHAADPGETVLLLRQIAATLKNIEGRLDGEPRG